MFERIICLIYMLFHCKLMFMKNTVEKHLWLDIGEDAQRQYIDARAVFTALESAKQSAAEVRGGMHWQNKNGTDYLFRTSVYSSQKSLGPRSEETEAIYKKFFERKELAEKRVSDLSAQLNRHQRMNRALGVGRAPRMLIDILNVLAKSGLAEFFTVIGTHALYAYESAAGVRIGESESLATRDIDLLWDVRRRLNFISQMKALDTSFLGLLKKVDSTFEIRSDQLHTAINNDGFEVDVIRREVKDGDPHPLRLTDDEDEFYAVQAKKAGILLDGSKFSCMVVATSGHMARMTTISPLTFAKFKRWMAEQPDRDHLKRRRDILQAGLVEELAREYLQLEI
jgi:hypothetical protein